MKSVEALASRRDEQLRGNGGFMEHWSAPNGLSKNTDTDSLMEGAHQGLGLNADFSPSSFLPFDPSRPTCLFHGIWLFRGLEVSHACQDTVVFFFAFIIVYLTDQMRIASLQTCCIVSYDLYVYLQSLFLASCQMCPDIEPFSVAPRRWSGNDDKNNTSRPSRTN